MSRPDKPVTQAMRDSAKRLAERVPPSRWTWGRYFVRPETAQQFKIETPPTERYTEGAMLSTPTEVGAIPGPELSISPAEGLPLDLLLVTDVTGRTHCEVVRLGTYG